MINFTLASQGVFRTIQGEGALLGQPMVFVRFAGCSIGCRECDTDYSKKETISLNELIIKIVNLYKVNDYVWLTGGEPTDQKHVHHLANELKKLKFEVAIATAGTKRLLDNLYDWISVSPHRYGPLLQTTGNEVKIVPGLNGLEFFDIKALGLERFEHKFIQPLYGEDPKKCIDFVLNNPPWKLNIQAHKIWNIQ